MRSVSKQNQDMAGKDRDSKFSWAEIKRYIKTGCDFDSLREHPRFQKLLDSI